MVTSLRWESGVSSSEPSASLPGCLRSHFRFRSSSLTLTTSTDTTYDVSRVISYKNLDISRFSEIFRWAVRLRPYCVCDTGSVISVVWLTQPKSMQRTVIREQSKNIVKCNVLCYVQE